MFSKANEIAEKYTHPVIVSIKYFNQRVESGVGSFVILNNEGWIITAAHILQPLFIHQQHAYEIKQFNERVAAIKTNSLWTDNEKQQHINSLSPNPNWITNFSFWWGNDVFVINHFEVLGENDLAIGRIENYHPTFQSVYPKFKNPSGLKIGSSLCKLGFPFHNVKTEYIESQQSFRIDPSFFPIPRFPLEGIFTRNVFKGKSKDQRFEIKFIETSTPGLRGQSGGPTFDVDGNIWAIQSQTQHLDLGFSPKVVRGNSHIEENQFLNVGWGVHVESILRFLTAHNVRFEVSEN